MSLSLATHLLRTSSLNKLQVLRPHVGEDIVARNSIGWLLLPDPHHLFGSGRNPGKRQLVTRNEMLVAGELLDPPSR